MITSKQQMFSEAQELTATGNSTNIIDLGATGRVLGAPADLVRDIGKGRPIPITVRLDEDADGTSPALDVELQVDADEAFSNPTTVATATQVAGGNAGDEINLHYVPRGANERYMRLRYTLDGTSPVYVVTAGIALAKPARL